MFSDNRKISGRQTTRLLIYDITGVSSLLLPPLLAETAGGDGIFCIFLALIPAYLFLGIIKNVQKRMDEGYPEYIKKNWGTFASGVILILYYLFSVLLAGYVLFLLSRLVSMQLLKNESYTLICTCILLLGGYGIMGGIEGKARIYEILFWFIMIPLLLMLLLAVKDVNTDYWTPVLSCGWKRMLEGTGIVFLFYMLIYFILFLFSYEKHPNQSVYCAKKALGISALLNAAIYLITLGIFGQNALASMDYPVVTLMSMIKIPGGFFERQDAFMVAIWFFALYALINSGMFYGTECLKKLIPKKGNKRYVLVTMILTFAAASVFYVSTAAVEQYRQYLVLFGVPFLILIPLLLSFRKKTKICTIALLILSLSTCGLTGCSSVELEKRNFPLAIALDEDEQGYSLTLSFQNLSEIANENAKDTQSKPAPVKETSWYEAFASANSDQPGTMDYNHVKALIFAKSVLDDKDALTEFLDYIKKQEVFSRNTLLYVSEGTASSVIDMDENLELPVGTYLEQMTEGQEELKNSGVVTLGNVINESSNKQETLYIPVISNKDGKPVISSYYVISSFGSVGVVDEETFLTAMLLENKLNKYQFHMDTGESVELSSIHLRYEMTEENGACLEKIYVTAEARLQNKTIDGSQKQKEMEKKIEEYLELNSSALASSNLKEKNLDISNSYYRLGGYDRAMYEKYHGKQDAYLKNLNYEINYSIQLIDE